MKILHLLSQTQLTGAEVFAQVLTDELILQGHQVWVVSDELHLPFKSEYIPMVLHPRGLVRRFKNILKLRKLILSEKIQILHTHSRAGVRVGYWASLFTPCAMISQIHGRQHSSFSKRLWDQYGETVLGVCENILEALKNDFNMSPRKMKLLRNPVDLTDLNVVEVLNSKKRLGILGRFTGPKGERLQQIITKCFEMWLLEDPDLHIDIVGGSRKLLSPLTLKFIDELNKTHGPRIEIKEHVSNLKAELKNYQLVIAAGRIAIEAITQGIPCMALGEFNFEGLVTINKYPKQVKSNFGDMGVTPSDLFIDYKIFAEKVSSTFVKIHSKEFELERIQLAHLARADFAKDNVISKIIRIYESTYLKKNKPKWIPILMYHQVLKVENDSPHRIFITESNFEKHLDFLKKNEFTTLHFSDLKKFREGQLPLSDFPIKPVILTFDDGYKNNLEIALPLLKKYQMKATIYLLANPELKTNLWDKDSGAPSMELLNSKERKKLASSNLIEIGSHGFDHKKLTTLNADQAWQEILNSKQTLETEFGNKILSYAYTYGIRSDRDVQLAEKAGYDYAVNTDYGALHLEENPWSVFRVNIFPEDGPPELKKKTSSWYRRYYYYKRGK